MAADLRPRKDPGGDHYQSAQPQHNSNPWKNHRDPEDVGLTVVTENPGGDGVQETGEPRGNRQREQQAKSDDGIERRKCSATQLVSNLLLKERHARDVRDPSGKPREANQADGKAKYRHRGCCKDPYSRDRQGNGKYGWASQPSMRSRYGDDPDGTPRTECREHQPIASVSRVQDTLRESIPKGNQSAAANQATGKPDHHPTDETVRANEAPPVDKVIERPRPLDLTVLIWVSANGCK